MKGEAMRDGVITEADTWTTEASAASTAKPKKPGPSAGKAAAPKPAVAAKTPAARPSPATPRKTTVKPAKSTRH